MGDPTNILDKILMLNVVGSYKITKLIIVRYLHIYIHYLSIYMALINIILPSCVDDHIIQLHIKGAFGKSEELV